MLAPLDVLKAEDGAVDRFVRKASEVAEFRAAAYLRAASFYTYPPDRSQYAARMHQRMKADTEWAAIEAKIAGADTDWKGPYMFC